IERISRREDALLESRKQHGRTAEPAKLLRCRVALRFPKCVEQTDQRRALAEVIVQVEQLKTAQAGRPQIRFDFLFVARQLKPTGGFRQILVLVEQTMRG